MVSNLIKSLGGLIVAGLLVLPGPAFGQCTGQFQPGNLCANGTGGVAPVKETAPSAWLDRAFSSSPGAVLNRGSSLWLATPNPVLGNPGSTVGTLGFSNLTSGAITVSPPTGALGTATNTLQAVSDTFVYRATTDTLTNKTLTSSTDTLGGVTMGLGSDATGDIYYRNSGGQLARLPIGGSTNVLTVSGGLPVWQSAVAACPIATVSTLGCVKGDGATLSISGAGVISINLAEANIWTNTITINPTSGTTTQGLVTSSTAPASGSQTSVLNFNVINVSNPGYSVPINGAVLDSYGVIASISAFRANLTTAVASGSDQNAIWGAIVETAPTGFIKGITGSAYSNISASGDTIYGIAGYTNVGPSGNINFAASFEAESAIATGGATAYRAGFYATSFGPGQAATVDTAIAIAQGTALSSGTPPYSTSAPYVNGITFLQAGSGRAPLATTGSVIFSDASFTTGSFANLSNVIFNNQLFNFPGLVVNGSGATNGVRGIIGSSTLPGTANQIWTVTAASAGSVAALASANGASGFDAIQAADSTGSNEAGIFVWEASNTGVKFGQTSGNYAGLISFNPNNLGLMVGTLTNEPLIVGTNNTEWLNLTGAGALNYLGSQLTLGNAGSVVGKLAFVNATSGSIALSPPTGALGTQTLTLPDATATLAGLSIVQTWSALQTFNTSDLAINGGSTTAGLASVTSGGVVSSCAACTLATSLAIGNVGNTINAGVLLQLSNQAGVAAHAPTYGGSNTVIQAISANETNNNFNVIEFDNFVNGVSAGSTANILTGLAMGGTAASPTATGSGQLAWIISGGGFDGTNYVPTTGVGPPANLVMAATANWTTSTHEMKVTIQATPPASITPEIEAVFQNGVLIGSSGTQPGAGKLAITGIISAATTSAVCVNTSTFVLSYDSTIGTCNTSDERLKDFDGRLIDALPRLVALSKDDHFGYFHASGAAGRAQFGREEHIGIGAQTVAKFFPQLTAVDSDGLYSLAYDKLTVPIIEALAELKADNDNLRNEVERLKRRSVQ